VQVVKTRQVAGQLASIEARRIALHPATLFGAALSIWTMWGLNVGEAPVLNRAGTNVAFPLGLLAGGALIAASSAAVRMWNTERSEAIDITPASERARTLALLAGCSAAVAIGLVLQLLVLGWMMLNGPVTALNWWEVLAGPATVGLAISVGVAAGRWFPSRAIGPLALIALIGASIYLQMVDTIRQFGEQVRWLSPAIPLEFDPVELTFRAPAAHLLYLLGLALLFASLALLKGNHSWMSIPITGLAVSVVVVALSAVSQAQSYDRFDYEARLQALLPPSADYLCTQNGRGTYCAYPGYEGWIEEWAALVEPVLDLAPDEVSGRGLTVQQYPTHALDHQGSVVEIDYEPGLATGMWWGRQVGGDGDTWGDAYPFGMALGAAAWAVGLPLEPVAGTWELQADGSESFVPGTEGHSPDDVSYSTCDTWNQGRAVVALWMASQASPVTEQHLTNQIEHPRNRLIETFEDSQTDGTFTVYNFWDTIGVGQPYPWYALEFHNREAYYAYQLLEQPHPEVAEAIHNNWNVLTDPETTTVEALALLGVSPLADYERNHDGSSFDWYPACS
jgi:hypothetical protein